MGAQSTDAIKFCFRKRAGADVRALKRVDKGCRYKKGFIGLERTRCLPASRRATGTTAMKFVTERRHALRTFALTMATSAIGVASAAAEPAVAAVGSALTPPGATNLDELKKRLAQSPRRRDFKTVPMILNDPEQWDHEALTEVLSYGAAQRQVWDNTAIGGPWLNLMRNALNSQIWSFRHPDFLAVSVTHGSALLALYDQAMWDKYRLTRLAGDKFRTN